MKLRILLRMLKYLKQNLGVPFIVAFQLLFAVCAMLLIQGQEVLANRLAIYAFCSFVLGAILQCATYLREILSHRLG